MAIEDDRVGVGVGLRYMPEEYPKALRAAGTGDGIDVYLWKGVDGKRLSLKRYSEEMSWGEGEGVYADGTGTAKTSEFFVHFLQSLQKVRKFPDLLRGLANTAARRNQSGMDGTMRSNRGICPS